MRLQNPTQYFFKQAEDVKPVYKERIQKFVSNLVDLNKCGLCRESFDLQSRLPRILIHCGHTICTSCLNQFYRKGKLRCPMCLKLIRNLDRVQILPLNHTIFKNLVDEWNRNNTQQLNADQELFRLFDLSQKIRADNQRIDRESGLTFCALHTDRVQHFFCQFHKVLACRVCCQAGHTKRQCLIVDLYEIEDPQGYLVKAGMAQNDNEKELLEDEDDQSVRSV